MWVTVRRLVNDNYGTLANDVRMLRKSVKGDANFDMVVRRVNVLQDALR